MKSDGDNMNIKELDKKLKQLNDIEKKAHDLYNTKITTEVEDRKSVV